MLLLRGATLPPVFLPCFCWTLFVALKYFFFLFFFFSNFFFFFVGKLETGLVVGLAWPHAFGDYENDGLVRQMKGREQMGRSSARRYAEHVLSQS